MDRDMARMWQVLQQTGAIPKEEAYTPSATSEGTRGEVIENFIVLDLLDAPGGYTQIDACSHPLGVDYCNQLLADIEAHIPGTSRPRPRPRPPL